MKTLLILILSCLLISCENLCYNQEVYFDGTVYVVHTYSSGFDYHAKQDFDVEEYTTSESSVDSIRAKQIKQAKYYHKNF